MTDARTRLAPLALGLVAALALAACGGQGSYSDESAPKAAAQSQPASAAAVTAILAKADAVDGATDKVVSKCAQCALGMDGDAANAITVHGYEMHFCSDYCKGKFGENADASVMALKVPKS